MKKKYLITFLFSALSLMSWADEVSVSITLQKYNENVDSGIVNVTFRLLDDHKCRVKDIPTTTSGRLNLPSTIRYNNEDYTLVSIGYNAFNGSQLTSVNVPSTVTEIQAGAFCSMPHLTSFTIPSSVTHLSTGLATSDRSYYGSFQYSGLKSITIPSTIQTIQTRVFEGCSKLKSVTLESGLSVLGEYMFDGCPIESITIPSSITTIPSWCFENCSQLSTVVISEGVQDIGYSCFSRCYNISNLTLPTTTLRTIGDYAFECASENLGSLGSLVIPEGVTSIGINAFKQAGLTSVTIPSTVEHLRLGTFINNPDLATVTLKTGLLSIGNYTGQESGEPVFKDCVSLTSLTIPNTVTYLGEAFQNTGLVSVTLSSELTCLKTNLFSGCTSLSSVSVPAKVTSIEEGVFSSCTNLTTVTFPANSELTSIGNWAFYNCSSLRSITLPESVTSIGTQCFRGSGIESITLPPNLSGISPGLFWGCQNLTNVTFPASVTSLGESIFYESPHVLWVDFVDCTGLSEWNFNQDNRCSLPGNAIIYLPKGNTSSGINMVQTTDGENFTCPSFTYYYINYGSMWNWGWADYNIPRSFNAKRIKFADFHNLRDPTLRTICLPYDFSSENLRVYAFDTKNSTAETLVFKEIAQPQANTPYIFYSTADVISGEYDGDEHGNLGKLEGGKVYATPEEISGGETSSYKFLGTLSLMSNQEAVAKGAYVLQGGGEWRPVAEGEVKIRAGKGYIMPKGGKSLSRIYTSIGDGGETDMESIRLDHFDGTSSWYSLDGRKLSGKPSNKGVYIKDGSKVIIK